MSINDYWLAKMQATEAGGEEPEPEVEPEAAPEEEEPEEEDA